MRVDIDEQLERILQEIKHKNWRITGRGHSETIRFLANFYMDHTSIEEMVDGHLKTITNGLPEIIQKATLQGVESSFLGPLREALIKILEARK